MNRELWFLLRRWFFGACHAVRYYLTAQRGAMGSAEPRAEFQDEALNDLRHFLERFEQRWKKQ